MRYGYWMPVFGGWLRNVQDEEMEATWEYNSRLARRSEQIGFDLSLIATAPSVAYRAFLTDGGEVDVDNPTDLPDATRLDHIDESAQRRAVGVPHHSLKHQFVVCVVHQPVSIQPAINPVQPPIHRLEVGHFRLRP